MTAIARLKGHGLGCRFARDPRDKRFLLRERLTDLDWQNVTERQTPWKLGPTLDQGQTSKCTRYSLAHRRGARPIFTADPEAEIDDKYYQWAIENDEFPGADPEGGTTIRAICNAAIHFGVAKAYYWAYSIQTGVRYVRRFGPLNVGTEWTDQMFEPDADGIIVPNGAVAGGHAYLWYWHERAHADQEISPDDLLWYQNSWGTNWANAGLFKMRLGDFQELMEDRGGEVTEIVERSHRHTPVSL